jgi:hypothetical protein
LKRRKYEKPLRPDRARRIFNRTLDLNYEKAQPMNDRPDFDPEKLYDSHRSKWYDDSKYYMSELEFLEQKIEAKLDQINEQLSALFQLAAKNLSESLDAVIDADFQTKKFLDIDLEIRNIKKELCDLVGADQIISDDITDLYGRIFEIEKIEAQENQLKGLQDKPNNE